MSNENNNNTETVVDVKDDSEKKKELAPKDVLLAVHFLFFFLGLMHFIPNTFFNTANKYWMYKFRNTSIEDFDPNKNRTVLQTNFGAASNVCSSVPLIFFSTLTTVYGHHVRSRLRINAAISAILFCFCISTSLILIDSDEWQTTFFVTMLVLLALKSAGNSILSVSLFDVLHRFPESYLKWYLTGEGIAGIFNSVLQISSLAIGTSVQQSALIYFICGDLVMLVTLLLFIFAKNSAHYQYFIQNSDESRKKEMLTWKETKSILKKIWSSIATFVFMVSGLQIISPAINSLIVSEYAGTAWSATYFVPTVTYFLSNLGDLIGRSFASKMKKHLNVSLLTIINIVRPCVFVILYIFCNAQPRHNLSVWFPHDYQYALIVASYGLSGGYLFNEAWLNIKRLVPKEQLNNAYSVLVTAIGVIGAISSAFGYISLNIL